MTFKPQNVQEAAAQQETLQDYETRYYFTPFLTTVQNNIEYLPGSIHCITQTYRTEQAHQLALVGMTTESPGVKIVRMAGGRGDLWAYPITPGRAFAALLADAASVDAGARELMSLRGYQLDEPGQTEGIDGLNGWLFSQGGKTLAQLRASLSAVTKELYAQRGLPETKQAADAFARVRDDVRQGIDMAEIYANTVYASYLQAFQMGKAGSNIRPFVADRRYQTVREWLGQVDVADNATNQIVEQQHRAQAALVAPMVQGFDKLADVIDKMDERSAAAEKRNAELIAQLTAVQGLPQAPGKLLRAAKVDA